MADGIGRIFGGSSYGVGGYVPQRKDESVDEQNQNQAQPQQNFEETQVNPERIMDLLAKNNYFIPAADAAHTSEVGSADAETEDRVAGYMERFEQIYALVEEEFGAELAPAVMDLVMDKLIGMV